MCVSQADNADLKAMFSVECKWFADLKTANSMRNAESQKRRQASIHFVDIRQYSFYVCLFYFLVGLFQRVLFTNRRTQLKAPKIHTWTHSNKPQEPGARVRTYTFDIYNCLILNSYSGWQRKHCRICCTSLHSVRVVQRCCVNERVTECVYYC